MTSQWIEEVAGACRTAGIDYLDVIIDQAGLDRSVIPALTVLALEWQSLYQGLPEEFIVDAAPLITRVNLDDAQQMQWLQALSQQVPLLGICSSWGFSALSAWLAGAMYGYFAGRKRRDFSILRYAHFSVAFYARAQ